VAREVALTYEERIIEAMIGPLHQILRARNSIKELRNFKHQNPSTLEVTKEITSH